MLQFDATTDEGIGDILFYKSHGAIIERLISWVTKSPYVHTAIRISKNVQVEATTRGVITTPYRTPDRIWRYAENAYMASPIDMAVALSWLQDMQGRKYGFADFIGGLNPFKNIFYFAQSKKVDCSGLCLQFLIKAGGVALGELAEEPHLATPGDLACTLLGE